MQFSPLIPGSESLEELPSSSVQSISLLAPPGTTERRYALAHALRALLPGGRLFAFGPKDKGGARIRKELESFGCTVEEESRAHQKICSAVRPAEILGLDDALDEGAPRFLHELQLYTQPGVFSWNRVDPGSLLLAANLPSLSGTGADLGAGIGYLSREILKSPQVKKLFSAELDGRAVRCLKKNAPGAEALWLDVRDPLPFSNLDFVVMNPPFHDGGANDIDLGRIFISQAAHVLKAGGTCWLVANRHLPYEEVLRSLFSSVKLLAHDTQFKIYEAAR